MNPKRHPEGKHMGFSQLALMMKGILNSDQPGAFCELTVSSLSYSENVSQIINAVEVHFAHYETREEDKKFIVITPSCVSNTEHIHLKLVPSQI